MLLKATEQCFNTLERAEMLLLLLRRFPETVVQHGVRADTLRHSVSWDFPYVCFTSPGEEVGLLYSCWVVVSSDCCTVRSPPAKNWAANKRKQIELCVVFCFGNANITLCFLKSRTTQSVEEYVWIASGFCPQALPEGRVLWAGSSVLALTRRTAAGALAAEWISAPASPSDCLTPLNRRLRRFWTAWSRVWFSPLLAQVGLGESLLEAESIEDQESPVNCFRKLFGKKIFTFLVYYTTLQYGSKVLRSVNCFQDTGIRKLP